MLVCKVADPESHFVSHVLGTCVLDGSSVKVEETPIKAEIIESTTTQFPIITQRRYIQLHKIVTAVV